MGAPQLGDPYDAGTRGRSSSPRGREPEAGCDGVPTWDAAMAQEHRRTGKWSEYELIWQLYINVREYPLLKLGSSCPAV